MARSRILPGFSPGSLIKKALSGNLRQFLAYILSYIIYYLPELYLTNRIRKSVVTRSSSFYLPGRISKADTVVMVGLSRSWRVHMLANLVGPNGQVLIFEPEDENFRSAKEESKKYQWVSIDQRGVWSKKGYKSFKIAPPTHPGNHKIPIENTEHPTDYVSSYQSTKQIEVAPLDSLLLEYSIDPDHIEITVNGAEYHVLRGSTHTLKEHKPSLWVKGWLQDTTSNRSVTDDIKALLDECNYEIATTKSVVRDDICEIEKVDGDIFAY